jgi:small multidrug resistance family-3 protein
MTKLLQSLPPFVFVLIATLLEVTGDALIRKSIFIYTGPARIGFMFIGAFLLFGYGFSLNLAPVEFGQVVGLYIATLFIVWQVITYLSFGSVPGLPILVGGALIVSGGLLITFWK